MVQITPQCAGVPKGALHSETSGTTKRRWHAPCFPYPTSGGREAPVLPVKHRTYNMGPPHIKTGTKSPTPPLVFYYTAFSIVEI